jgi:hypothetical protein
MLGARLNNCDIDRAIQDNCFTLRVMTAGAIIDFSKEELWTNVETTFNMLTAHFCKNKTFFVGMFQIANTCSYFHRESVSLKFSVLYTAYFTRNVMFSGKFSNGATTATD